MKTKRFSLYLSTPTNTSAYGRTEIPCMAINSESAGPHVLLMAGSHGDEYEGQIALRKIENRFESSVLKIKTGSVTIIPHANFPACANSTRLSPLDNGDLSNSFTGVADTPTQSIAQMIEDRFMKKASVILDFHSGGHSLQYAPTAMTFAARDDARLRDTINLMDLFPVDFLALKQPWAKKSSVFNTAARHGGIYIASEFGGSGQLCNDYCDRIIDATHNVLFSLGMIDAPEVHRSNTTPIWVQCERGQDRIYAPHEGVFESMMTLGREFSKGSLAGQLYPFTASKPVNIHNHAQGHIIAVRPIAHCKQGDCLAEIGQQVARP